MFFTLASFLFLDYNEDVASSGRSAVSPVSEVSGLTHTYPGNTLRLVTMNSIL